jgi:hypothetical protein
MIQGPKARRPGTFAPGRLSLVRWPQTFTGSSRAQAAPRCVVVAADTTSIGGSSALRCIHLDPAITPATFVATALADGH